MKKTGKDRPEITVMGIDGLLGQIKDLRKDYDQLTKVEDGLINSLEQRLNHLKVVFDGIEDPKVLQQYFETRLNRVILDYMLQNNHFEAANCFSKQNRIQVFSDIHIFQETHQILQKLKQLGPGATPLETDNALECALSWCNTYKTKLQKSGSALEFNLRML